MVERTNKEASQEKLVVDQPTLTQEIREAVDDESELAQELLLPDQFHLLELIGEGGMSQVYKVEMRNESNALRALKVLRKEMMRDVQASKRFLKECDAIRELSHENIVQIHGSGMLEDGRPYLLLEFIEGQTLKQLLKVEGHLPAHRALYIAHQIVCALIEAHAKGIIHRDLKPSNILISKGEDGTDLVRVVDFGIAKTKVRNLSETADLTKTGDIFGSPEYMSVEQCLGNPIDERSDIYSLACVMYEMLTGRSPFAAESPIKTILKHVDEEAEPFSLEFAKLEISPEIEALIFDCLQKDPRHRLQTAKELEKKLRSMIEFKDDVYQFGLIGPRIIAMMFDFGLVMVAIQMSWAVVRMFLPPALWPSTALMFIIAFPVYKGVMESGKKRGTFGMQACGLKALDPTGGIIDFWRAASVPVVMYGLPFGALGIAAMKPNFFQGDCYWIGPFLLLMTVICLSVATCVFNRRLKQGAVVTNHRQNPRFAYTMTVPQSLTLIVSLLLFAIYFFVAINIDRSLLW